MAILFLLRCGRWAAIPFTLFTVAVILYFVLKLVHLIVGAAFGPFIQIICKACCSGGEAVKKQNKRNKGPLKP